MRRYITPSAEESCVRSFTPTRLAGSVSNAIAPPRRPADSTMSVKYSSFWALFGSSAASASRRKLTRAA